MKAQPPGPDRLACAMAPLLDDLEQTNAWLKDLDAEFKKTAKKRETLIASAGNLLQSMDKATRDRFVHRYAHLSARAGRRTRKSNSPLRWAMEFLLSHEHDHVRAVELTWYMQRAGLSVDQRYGPNALRELALTGHVTRTGHGVYRINRTHPEMLSIHLDLLGKEHRRLMSRMG